MTATIVCGLLVFVGLAVVAWGITTFVQWLAEEGY